MTNRTLTTTVAFAAPFSVRAVGGVQPAGEYLVVTDDELIEGISRVAYRRVATLLQLPAIAARATERQLVPIAQADLDAALLQDRRQAG